MINFLKTTRNCGINDFCTDIGVKKTFRYFGYLLFFLKIIIPLLLIVMATIDIFKAITTPSPDEEFKKSIFSIIKRIVAGLLIFFAPTIIYFVIDSIYSFEKIQDCASCLFKPFICDLSKIEKCEIKVKNIKIDNCKSGSLELTQGDFQKLYPKFTPADANNTSIKWKTNKKSIVSVDQLGYITAKKKGNVTITVSLKNDTSIKAKCKIKVSDRPKYDSKGDESSSSGVTSSKVGNYTYYNQCSAEYKGTGAFCNSDPCSVGCGAFALTMVIANLSKPNVTPSDVMEWLCNNGHYGGAMGEDFFDTTKAKSKKLQEHYNLKTTNINGGTGYPSAKTLKKMGNKLKKGEMLICVVPYHFIVLAGDSSGNVTVLDPGNVFNNKTYTSVESAYKAIYNFWYQKNGNKYSGSVWSYKKAN